MADNDSQSTSLLLAAHPQHVRTFLDHLDGRESLAHKTRLNRAECLKKVIHFLSIQLACGIAGYTGRYTQETLNICSTILTSFCAKHRPQAKIEDQRSSSLSEQIKRRHYITENELKGLEKVVSENLDRLYTRLVATLPEVRFDSVALFQRYLVTALFLNIPTQRRHVIAEMRRSECRRLDSERLYIWVENEKSMYRRQGIKDSVGRAVYLDKLLSRCLLLWLEQVLPHYPEVASMEEGIWLRQENRMAGPEFITRCVKKATRQHCGIALSPLSLRKIKITHFVNAVRDRVEEEATRDRMISDFAIASGHSKDALWRHYYLKDVSSTYDKSREITELSKSLLFKKRSEAHHISSTSISLPVQPHQQANQQQQKHRQVLQCVDLSMAALHPHILKKNEWLSDEHIGAAFNLLRKCFPDMGGIENPVIVASGFSSSAPLDRRSAYIVHTDGNHWVAIISSGIGQTVQIFDSLYTLHTRIDVQRAICLLFPNINVVERMPFQQQMSSCNCGLFALAAVTDFCIGLDPSIQRYMESEMRSHFNGCIISENFIEFPKSCQVITSRPAAKEWEIVNHSI